MDTYASANCRNSADLRRYSHSQSKLRSHAATGEAPAGINKAALYSLTHSMTFPAPSGGVLTSNFRPIQKVRDEAVWRDPVSACSNRSNLFSGAVFGNGSLACRQRIRLCRR